MANRSARRVATALVTTAAILAISRDDLDPGTWWWAAPLVALVAVALVWIVPVGGRALPPGWVPLLLVAVTAVAYGCVPETDQLPWIGAVAFGVGAVEVWRDRPLAFGWVFGAALAVLWAVVYGATGRESALVGALFAWWPVVLLPAIARYADRLRSPRQLALGLVLLPLVAAPAVVARTGALEPTVRPALESVALAAPASLAATGVLLVLLVRRR